MMVEILPACPSLELNVQEIRIEKRSGDVCLLPHAEGSSVSSNQGASTKTTVAFPGNTD